MTHPIYVASKGRPDAPVFGLLTGEGIDYTVIVEPQDQDLYAAHLNVLVLPDNDRGLAYARQAALAQARSRAEAWYWMLDDDIKGFYRSDNGKTHLSPAAAVLWDAERAIVGESFVAQGGLEYQQYAWSNEPGKVTRNSYCDCAVLTSTAVLADFREELPLKVDRDFTLQIIASGWDTIRVGWLSFAVPSNGSNEGGQHDVYDSLTDDGMRREEWASRRLAELWPGIVEFKVKPNGRPDAKIHWRRARG